MNYDVLEEAKNAVNNLEQNAWENHKEEYVNSKANIEDFRDRIKVEEINIKEATTQEEIDKAQSELTKIIDEIIKFNDDFNASLIETNDADDLVVPEETFKVDDSAVNEFLNRMSEEE